MIAHAVTHSFVKGEFNTTTTSPKDFTAQLEDAAMDLCHL